MKICFFSMNLYIHGGIQRVAPNILNALAINHDITVLMPYDETKDNNIFGLNETITIKNLLDFPKHNKATLIGACSIIVWKINRKTGILDRKKMVNFTSLVMFSNRQKKALIEYFNSNNFDIIVGITDYYTLLLSIIAPELNAVTIGWEHNTFESYYEMKGRNSYGLKHLSQKEYSNLNSLFVLTNSDKDKFSKFFNVPVHTMYNPVSVFNETLETDITKDLLFVGRLYEYQKGLDYLVTIMKKVVESLPNCRLNIVGDGVDRDKLERMISENNLNESVKVLGMTSEVGKFYSNSSILLHTSRYEGFGVVLIEAMSFGLPVIAFHNNGPDEIIYNGVNGFLINKYDINEFVQKVITLLSNAEMYKNMSQKAKERAKDFSHLKIADFFEQQLVEIYNSNPR